LLGEALLLGEDLLLGEATLLRAGDVGGDNSSIDDPNEGSIAGTPAFCFFQKAMALLLLVD
jgi:hypothetical protein